MPGPQAISQVKDGLGKLPASHSPCRSSGVRPWWESSFCQVMPSQGEVANGQSHQQHLVDGWGLGDISPAANGEETWPTIQGAVTEGVRGRASTLLRETGQRR